jgi:hypothetical protein
LRKKHILFAILALVLSTLACNALSPQTEPTSGDLPLTEAEVPRVTIEEAKAALDSGTAVIVDVRNATAYEQSHIANAVSIPLDEIENNPAGLNVDKEQWIITYCA